MGTSRPPAADPASLDFTPVMTLLNVAGYLSTTLSAAHTLSRTNTHSFSLGRTHSLSAAHTLSRPQTRSLGHTHTHTLSLSATHTHSLSLGYTHTLSRPHTHTHSLGTNRDERVCSRTQLLALLLLVPQWTPMDPRVSCCSFGGGPSGPLLATGSRDFHMRLFQAGP
jgi:hypothetical protein